LFGEFHVKFLTRVVKFSPIFLSFALMFLTDALNPPLVFLSEPTGRISSPQVPPERLPRRAVWGV
jgi:hypothetical protein